MDDIKIDPSDFSVLVCDDEESVRGVLGEALGNWGFIVATAPSGEAALEHINENELPHIVLTDVRMGGMTGLDLAREVKKLSNEVEVVVMTSQGSFDTAVQATKIGVYDYLAKPFESLEDVKSVLMHVAQRIYLKLYNEYLVDELKIKNKQIQGLADMTDEMSQSLDVAKTIQIGVSFISNVMSSSPVCFFQFVPRQRALVATTRMPNELFGGAQPKFPIPAAAAKDMPAMSAFLKEVESDDSFQKFLQKSDAMSPEIVSSQGGEWRCQPFFTRNIPRGVFAVRAQDWDADLLHRYLRTIETFFENALLHVKVVENSIRDGLTKLHNVRFFREKITEEVSKAERIEHPCSLIFFDVDHFKNYNDKNGHPAGDALLRKMGAMLMKEFRKTDIVARYGGEEFVVLMPHTAFSDALAKAERFRMVVEKEKFQNEEKQPNGKLTISIGVSEYPSHASDSDALVKLADDALYEAKKTRNAVCQARAPKGYVPPFKSTRIESSRALQKGQGPKAAGSAGADESKKRNPGFRPRAAKSKS